MAFQKGSIPGSKTARDYVFEDIRVARFSPRREYSWGSLCAVLEDSREFLRSFNSLSLMKGYPSEPFRAFDR